MKYFLLFLSLICSTKSYSYDYLVESLRGDVKLQSSGLALKVNDELQQNDVIAVRFS